jgi:hypothetical protein
MADAMSRLLTERPLRARIISQARDRVVRDFNNKTLITELAALYRKEGIIASNSDSSVSFLKGDPPLTPAKS